MAFLQRHARWIEGSRPDLQPHQHRRPVHLRKSGHDDDHAHQRRAFRQAEAHRAGNDLVQELRRPPHPGLGPASARFPGRQEVSDDPGHSRRPARAYGYTFDHEFQWMAAKGYVVLYPNPRGSTTYGQEFGNIIQYHYPGDDFKDLMAGVDELIARGWVDPAKLGVTGGSGGGVLTNWVVGHTTASRPPFRSAPSPTGRASGTPPISPSSPPGSAARPGKTKPISRSARPSPTSTNDHAADADRGRKPTCARLPATAANRCSAR
jgi:hypothetical protein